MSPRRRKPRPEVRRTGSGSAPSAGASQRVPGGVLGIALGVIMGVAGGFWWGGSAAEDAGPGPLNLLLITLDTTRADHLGCYGHPGRTTPNIDQLAAGGVRFAQCMSAAPSTLPSHATILTGLYPHAHGVRDNVGFRLGEANRTLAEALRAAGYRTAAVVGGRDTGLDQGFETYGDTGDRHQRPGDEVCNRAIHWLETHATEKFFLWAHFFDPHAPYEPPDAYRRRFADPYTGEIAFADAQVGRLVEAIRRLGLDKKTLIVVTADHGEGLGEHGEETHLYFVYDTTMSVPLVMHCPGRVPVGAVVASQTRTVDIMPTILAILGASPEPNVQGEDLLSRMQQPSNATDLPAYGESLGAQLVFGAAPLRCLRLDGWKYIHAPKPELFRVRDDPQEKRNLATAEPDRLSAMREQIRSIIAQSPPPPVADAMSRPDRATLDKLQSLGYAASGTNVSLPGRTELDRFEPIGDDPKDRLEAIALIGRATLCQQTGRFAEAEELHRRLAAIFPESVDLALRLARSLFLQNRLEEAIAIHRTMLERHADSSDVQYGLGKLLDRVGRAEEAAGHFAEAVRLDPEYPNGYYDLGVVLRKLDRPDESLECFRQAVRARPTHVNARLNLGAALVARGDVDAGIEQYREALKAAPDDFGVYYNLGNALLRKGDRAGAAAAYREAVRLKPDFAPARQALADLE